MRHSVNSAVIGTLRPRSLVIAAGVVVVIGAACVREATLATNGDMSAARSAYPAIVGTRLDSCRLCHPAGSWRLDPYGRDYDGAGRDFKAIEPTDSDGDGSVNLAEIVALTFPGDPDDYPGPTATEGPSPTTTASAAPTEAATETPTAPATTVSPTAEPSRTPTVEVTPTPELLDAYLPLVGPRIVLR